MPPRTPPDGSPLALDRVIHGPLRLGIVAALAAGQARSFTELRDGLGTTDGNLNASLDKLERAGYVTSVRKPEGRGNRTEYSLTRAGQKALDAYLALLDRILAPVRSAPPRA